MGHLLLPSISAIKPGRKEILEQKSKETVKGKLTEMFNYLNYGQRQDGMG